MPPITKPPEIAKIIVGYRLRPQAPEVVEKFRPQFRAPANYKAPAKIDDYIMEKNELWTAEAALLPYAATFDEVFISDLANRRVNMWKWSEDRGTAKRSTVSQAVAVWLLAQHSNTWANEVVSGGPPKATFLGFNPRLFLKILGLECSMLAGEVRLPLGLWYDNSDHRDMANAIIPTEYAKLLSLRAVLQHRGIVLPEGWEGPGNDPTADANIVATLAVQLGMKEA